MSEKMTVEEFERHVIEHGADPNSWTQEAQSHFGPLLRDPLAQTILENHKMLSRYFDASEQILSDEAAENTFLSRLIDVPNDAARATSSTQEVTSGVFDRLFERVFSLSPIGLTSQAAGFSAVLLVGFLVGLTNPDAFDQEGYSEIEEVVDLSESYFADAGLYLEEGTEQ